MENLQLFISAEGANLTYQWQKNGIDIPGETSDQLTLDNLNQSDDGSYVCIITDELLGTVASHPSVLTVHLNPQPNVFLK